MTMSTSPGFPPTPWPSALSIGCGPDIEERRSKSRVNEGEQGRQMMMKGSMGISMRKDVRWR
jgi:hypothetical protein